jgi:hypothetical protein
MDKAHRAILDSLPPPRRRSKLEPYTALIRALRARGRSYRDIVTILRNRCGLRVAVHTVHSFVHSGSLKPAKPRIAPRPASRHARPSADVSSPPSVSDAQGGVWARITAVKHRAPASVAEPTVFQYDENEPLQLITPVPATKRGDR